MCCGVVEIRCAVAAVAVAVHGAGAKVLRNAELFESRLQHAARQVRVPSARDALARQARKALPCLRHSVESAVEAALLRIVPHAAVVGVRQALRREQAVRHACSTAGAVPARNARVATGARRRCRRSGCVPEQIVAGSRVSHIAALVNEARAGGRVHIARVQAVAVLVAVPAAWGRHTARLVVLVEQTLVARRLAARWVDAPVLAGAPRAHRQPSALCRVPDLRARRRALACGDADLDAEIAAGAEEAVRRRAVAGILLPLAREASARRDVARTYRTADFIRAVALLRFWAVRAVHAHFAGRAAHRPVPSGQRKHVRVALVLQAVEALTVVCRVGIRLHETEADLRRVAAADKARAPAAAVSTASFRQPAQITARRGAHVGHRHARAVGISLQGAVLAATSALVQARVSAETSESLARVSKCRTLSGAVRVGVERGADARRRAPGAGIAGRAHAVRPVGPPVLHHVDVASNLSTARVRVACIAVQIRFDALVVAEKAAHLRTSFDITAKVEARGAAPRC